MKNIHIVIKDNFALFFVNIITAAVDGYDAGEIFDLETVDCFAEQIGKSNERAFSYRVSVKCSRTADSGKIYGMIFDDGGTHFLAAFAFADHAFESRRKQAGGERVHACARRRAAAAAGFAAGSRAGTRIIDSLSLVIEWKRNAAVQHFADAFMSTVASSQNGSGKQHAFTRPQ